MLWQSGGKGKKNGSTSPQFNGVVDVQRKFIFGRNSEAETISQLKFLALDPCRPQLAHDNIQALKNHILRIRKVMVLKDSEAPWRKRKLEQFVKDKLRPPPLGFVRPNEPKKTKLSKKRKPSHVSSVSCLLNSDESTQCQDDKNTLSSRASSSILTFAEDFKDIPQAVDSDESVEGSNQISPESNPSVETSNEVQWLNSQTSDGVHSRLHATPHRSMRLLNFVGDPLQRKVIPVGPRFQSDVPDWAGPEDSSTFIGPYNNDPDNSKWLGTITWPIQTDNIKTTGKLIGKGRPVSCSCASSGSLDCVRRHVVEERLVLKCDLGPAFFSWKFDEMGEQISKVWSLHEQQSFELVVKARPSDNAKSFLKRALKCFSGKKGKDIVNYYFNVYIPNRMSMHTRSPSLVRQVDTDDEEDESEDCNYQGMGLQKKSGGRSRSNRGSKDLKGKYLRGSS